MTLRNVYKKCKAHLIELDEIFSNGKVKIDVNEKPVEYAEGKWGYSVCINGEKTIFTKLFFDFLVKKGILEKN